MPNRSLINRQILNTHGQTMNGGSESVGKSDIGSLKDCQTTDPLNSICKSTSVANFPPPPPTNTPITSAPADTGQTINEGSNSNIESVIGSPIPPPPPPTVTHIISHIISAQTGPDQTRAANNAKYNPSRFWSNTRSRDY